jgi:hypothetical protein
LSILAVAHIGGVWKSRDARVTARRVDLGHG